MGWLWIYGKFSRWFLTQNMLHTGTPVSCRDYILVSILYKWSSKSYRNGCGGKYSEMSSAALAGSTAPCMSPCRHLSLCRHQEWLVDVLVLCIGSTTPQPPHHPHLVPALPVSSSWFGSQLNVWTGAVGAAGGVRLGTSAAPLEVTWVQLSSSSLRPRFEDSCQFGEVGICTREVGGKGEKEEV